MSSSIPYAGGGQDLLAASLTPVGTTFDTAAVDPPRSQLYVVDDLSLVMASPPPEGVLHPERTPVGPFSSREEAERWAQDQCDNYGGGSYSIAPLRNP